MNKKIIFIVSVLLVVVVGIGVWLLQDQNENKNGNRGEDSVDITPKMKMLQSYIFQRREIQNKSHNIFKRRQTEL